MNSKLKDSVYIGIVCGLTLVQLFAFYLETVSGNKDLASTLNSYVGAPTALVLGLVFALSFGKSFPNFNKVMSKKLLQYSVVGLGFGMTLESAIASGSEGMLITIVSVFGTLAIGTLIGRKVLGVDWQTSYLISSGTAICGGSAIAAVGPVIKAKAESMSVALGVVFILNAIALFLFPPIGHMLDMSQQDFGTWSAIAIHDTSSVVGASGAYGEVAQQVATTVKLTRALWIVVIALITPFFFRKQLKSGEEQGKPWYKVIPTFIIWFVAAIVFNTFVLSQFDLGLTIGHDISKLAKHLITISLFFIGAGLTRETLKAVGIRPLIQGVALWVIISVLSLLYITQL